mmetsp:Transcript_4963/g.10317  ORF Transcript_4963/g.10317 Transcript_4963/m.10317 type:complete len:1029 (-) Transcript_4963:154-3240(-)
MSSSRSLHGNDHRRRMPMGMMVLMVAGCVIMVHLFVMSMPSVDYAMPAVTVVNNDNFLHQEEKIRNEKKDELKKANIKLQEQDNLPFDYQNEVSSQRSNAIKREKSSLENDLLLLGHHKRHDSVREQMQETAVQEHEDAPAFRESILSSSTASTSKHSSKSRKSSSSSSSVVSASDDDEDMETPQLSPTKRPTVPVPAPTKPVPSPTKPVIVKESILEPPQPKITAVSSSAKLGGPVLLLSSHQRLVLYDVDNDLWSFVDEGHGIYYGLLPGSSAGMVRVSRTVSVGSTPDAVMEIDLQGPTGKGYVKSSDVHSRYMHDAVMTKDRASVLVADVAGTVHELTLPELVPHKTLPVFTRAEHINTLAPTDHGTAWVVLHNIGYSKFVELDLATGFRLCTIENVGKQVHGFVMVDNGQSVISLSSKDAALIKIDMPKNCNGQMTVQASKTVIWQHTAISTAKPKFLKGLIVVDRIAYFGMSDFMSSREARGEVETSLIAVNIDTGKQLWERSGLGTKGIINIIGAPYVAVDSTWRELKRSEFTNVALDLTKRTWVKRTPQTTATEELQSMTPLNTGHEYDDLMSAQQKATQMSEESSPAAAVSSPSLTDSMLGEDSQCMAETLATVADAKIKGYAYGLTQSDEAFIRLPIKFDVEALKKDLALLENKYGYTFRADVNNYFILLVTLNGELEQGRIGPFTPVPDRLSLVPYTRKAMDALGAVVGRSRYMMLKAGEEVVRHTDDVRFIARGGARPNQRGAKGGGARSTQYSNGYWGRRFRVHIPVITHKDVKFGSGDSEVNMEAGYAYLFDNGGVHWVNNKSPINRTHLIFDTVGSPQLFELMSRSTIYKISGEVIEGDEPRMVPADPIFDKKIQPLTERWAGANVFSPVTKENLELFVNNEVVPRITDSTTRSAFQSMFNSFAEDWGTHCQSSSGPEEGTPTLCNTIAEKFMKQVIAKFNCENDVLRLENTSLTLLDAVEVIVRQAFFNCAPDLLESSSMDLSMKNSAPIFPVKNHPFRLPPCVPRGRAKKF